MADTEKVEELNENTKNMETEHENLEFHERKRWLFFGLPFTFTKYHITSELITTDSGLLNSKEDDCYIYKVKDVKLEKSFMEKIVGIGTVICYTGDTTDPILELKHIKHAKEVKNFILKASEIERSKRRILNTMDIAHGDLGAVPFDGADGIL